MNDTLLRALLRQPTDYTPVWLMRQAGRYLPEYNATRARAGSFLQLAKSPALAAEEARLDPGAEAATEQIRGVVADERTAGRRQDDQRHAQVAARRNDSGGDHRALARHERHQRIEQREQEDDRVRPPGRIGHQLRELVEQAASLSVRASPPLQRAGQA